MAAWLFAIVRGDGVEHAVAGLGDKPGAGDGDDVAAGRGEDEQLVPTAKEAATKTQVKCNEVCVVVFVCQPVLDHLYFSCFVAQSVYHFG